MSTFNIVPDQRILWDALGGTLSGEAARGSDGRWTATAANDDSASVTSMPQETSAAAVAYAIAAALDSDLVDPFDTPMITRTMLDLVVAVTGTYGGHENTGGGTMCATWTKGDITAVMGNDDTVVGLYRTAVWLGDEEGEHFALVEGRDDSFTDALRAVVRFLEQA